MAWEDYIPEKYGHNITLAEFAYMFFCSALNYEIDRLKDLKTYDEPFSKAEVESNNAPQTLNCPTQTSDDVGENDNIPLPSFGFATDTQAHWADVYSRLTKAKWIKREEVSQLEFIYIMCGVGSKRFLPIQWHGPTNALAYIVRWKLQNAIVERWEVSKMIFLNNNNKPLPKSFENSNPPGEKTKKKINDIFK